MTRNDVSPSTAMLSKPADDANNMTMLNFGGFRAHAVHSMCRGTLSSASADNIINGNCEAGTY